MIIQNFVKQFLLEVFKMFTVDAYTLWTAPNNSSAVIVW
jgi:hypothetical protein